MQPYVQQRKRRRIFFWLWFLPGLGVLLAGGIWYINQINDIEKLEIQKTEEFTSDSPHSSAEKDLGISKPDLSNGPIDRSIQPNSLEEGIEAFPDTVQTTLIASSHAPFSKPYSPTLEGISLPENDLARQEEQINLSRPSFLPLSSIATLLNPLPILPDSLEFAFLPLKEQRNRLPRFQFGLEANVGIFSNNRSLENNGDTTGSLIALRQQSERNLETISGEVSAFLKHRSGVYGRLGLSYTQIAERLDIQSSRIENDTIEGLEQIVINVGGDTTFVFGQVPITRTILYQKRTYNYYRLLDIPIGLGYEWKNGPWSIGVEGGAILNVRLSSEGEIRASSDAIVALDSISRTNLDLSYYLSLRASYEFRPNWSITLAPTFRYIPQAFTREEYPLEQRYNLLGGKLGIQYRF